jgi:hypothetical protein
MEILEGQTLADVLLRRYSKDPRGWSFIVAPARAHGFYDAIVASPDQSWHLKMDSVFKPAPLIVGARTEVDHGRVDSLSPTSFGFRELDPSMIVKFLSSSYGSEGGRPEPDGLGPKLESLLGLEPVVPRPGRSYAQGPFVLSPQKIVGSSERETSVDDRLTSDLLRLFRIRYPAYG